MTTATRFASLDNFEKGSVEIIGSDSAKRYLFSNMFDVAKRAQPWERVIIAKNLEFTIECARAEGASPWYLCAHDETVLAMQGEMEIHFLQPANADRLASAQHSGAVKIATEPAGKKMGRVKVARGHLTLLPAGAAYQIRPQTLGVLLFQSEQGAESIARWAAICQR